MTGNRHDRYMNILAKIASDVVDSPVGNARLAACIVYKNDIVSFGTNSMKTHPFQARYGRNKESIYLHAETSAIKNALNSISVSELSKCSLYICRVKFSDAHKQNLVFGLAKPCSGCFRCINTFGIRKVIFSLDNQSYGML